MAYVEDGVFYEEFELEEQNIDTCLLVGDTYSLCG